MAGETPTWKEVSREADEFCEDIRQAARLRQAVQELAVQAQLAASRLSRRSMFEGLPFRMSVSVSEDVDSYLVQDENIIEMYPDSFEATELRSISEHGVEFYDARTDSVLLIKGFDFEVAPIPKESSDESPGAS